jgi:hypothetical protein
MDFASLRLFSIFSTLKISMLMTWFSAIHRVEPFYFSFGSMYTSDKIETKSFLLEALLMVADFKETSSGM